MRQLNTFLVLFFAYTAPIFAQTAEENLFESCALVVAKDGQAKSAPFKLITHTSNLKVYSADLDNGYSVRMEHNNGQQATMTDEGLAYKSQQDHYEDSRKPMPVEEDPVDRAQFEKEHQAEIAKLERWLKSSGKDSDLQHRLDEVKGEKYEPVSKRQYVPPPAHLPPEHFLFKVEEVERDAYPSASVVTRDDITGQEWIQQGVDSEQKVFDQVVDPETGTLIFASPPRSSDDSRKLTLKSGGVINCAPQL